MARSFVRASSQWANLGSTAAGLVSRSVGTMALWVYKTDTTNIMEAFSFRVDSSNEIEITEFNGNFGLTLRANYNAAGTSKTVSTASLSANAWNHLALTWDSSADQVKFYVNGSQVGSTQTGLGVFAVGGSPTLYLSNHPTSADYWGGRMAEMGHWGVALSADEVAALNRGAAPPLVRPASLELYWPMIGRSTDEPDLVGGTSGTLTNSPGAGDHPRTFRPRGRRALAAPTAGIDGTLSATLDAATLSSSATVALSATLSATLADATLSSNATLTSLASGSVSATLDAATLSSAAQLALSGTLSGTLDAATLSSAGALAISGSLSGTLADASLSSSAALALGASLSATLDDATASAAGALALSASLSATLEAASLSATGTALTEITGSASVTLEDAISDALGRVLFWQSVSVTSETWTAASPTSETWTPVAPTSETWTAT